MFIVGSLLAGWILSWFGFDNVVQTGMKEVFDIAITQTGYYFVFGLLGAIKSIFFTLKPSRINIGKNE